MYTNLIRARAFVAVSGPSGAGKSTLVSEILVRSPDYIDRPFSLTTRPRREDENTGEYTFISREEFEERWKCEELINRDEAYGNLYGMSKASVELLYSNRKLPIKEIHHRNVGKLSALGFLVLPIHVFPSASAVQEIARRPERTNVSAAEDELGDVELANYTLMLRRTENYGGLTVDRVLRWLRASEYLAQSEPVILASACQPRGSNKVGYDAIAPEFLEDKRVTTAYFHGISEGFWRLEFFPQLKATGRYLEVGPGLGWLKRLGWPAGVDYQAIDISEEMRRRNVDAHRILLGDARCIPLESGALAGVFGSLLDPFLLPGFLLEIDRVLAPGGRFVGTSPAGEWARLFRGSDEVAETTFELADNNKLRVASYCHGSEELGRLFALAGFTGVSIRTVYANREGEQLPPAVASVFARNPSMQRVPVLHAWTAYK